jgi:hypothetical protein
MQEAAEASIGDNLASQAGFTGAAGQVQNKESWARTSGHALEIAAQRPPMLSFSKDSGWTGGLFLAEARGYQTC